MQRIACSPSCIPPQWPLVTCLTVAGLPILCGNAYITVGDAQAGR